MISDTMKDNSSAFDSLIIGAGSAGCVLVNRLTKDTGVSILLLEAEPRMNKRRMHYPCGRVIGGWSLINGRVHVRGNFLYYRRWEGKCARGWSYSDVLPYFRRAKARAEGGDAYRGDNRPLPVSNGTCGNTLWAAFVETSYGRTADMNGFRQQGFGRMDMTVLGGRRWSTANACHRPAL